MEPNLPPMVTDLWERYLQYVNAFRWETAVVDLRNPLTVVLPVALYVVGIFALNKLVTHPKSKEEARLPEWQPGRILTGVAFVHNMLLSLVSVLLFVGMFRGWWKLITGEGFFTAMCSSKGFYWEGGETSFWMFVFMISKWIEFGDTVLRVLMHKPLIFLHLWHHATVPVHCFIMLYAKWDSALFGFLFNSFVHIIMYYYYGLVQLKIRVWWKELVTLLQIFQFVSCFVLLGITFYGGDQCESNDNTKWAIISTMTFYLSYLILFILFYISTYNPKSRPTGSSNKLTKEKSH